MRGNRSTYFIQNEVFVCSSHTSGTMEMNEKFFYDPYEKEVFCPKCKEPIGDIRFGTRMVWCNKCQTFTITGTIIDNKISN